MRTQLFNILTIILLTLSLPGYAHFISNKWIPSTPTINKEDINSITEVICPEDINVCFYSPAFQLTGGLPEGGSYFDSAGVCISSFFDPFVFGLGNHLITYTFIENGLPLSCAFNITVFLNPQLTCPDDFQICLNSDILTLDMAFPAGGEYFGDGVFFNSFNSMEAGMGAHLITYYFTDPDGCYNNCSFIITVTEPPEVLCPSGFSVCVAEPPFALTGATPEGGIYMINGVVRDSLNPSMIGIGDHLIGYCYMDSSGCSESNSYILQVISLPFLDLGQTDTLLSDDFAQNVPMPYQLLFYGTGYSTVEWTCNGTGTFDNPNLTNPVYTFSQEDIDARSVAFTLTAQSEGLCTVNITGAKTVVIPSQLIDIPAGWSGISSFINPFDPEIEHVIAPCNQNLIVQVSIDGIYWREQSVNTLILWSTEIGYKVKYEQACCLPLFGSPVTWPSIIHLNAGVNYLPVHSKIPIKLTDVFGADTSKIILLIDIFTMQVFNPSFGMFNTLEYLEPGIGYLAYMSDSINITYPAATENTASNIMVYKREAYQVRNRTIWNDISNTGSMHFVLIEKTALPELAYGDYLGAFNRDGICTGMVEYTGKDKTILTVFGDDPFTTTQDGMTENEIISYRFYSNSNGKEYDLSVIYDPAFHDYNGLYVNYGLSRIIRMTKGTTSLNDLLNEKILIYPNPAQDYLIIKSDDQINSVKLSNFLGQNILTEHVENFNERMINVTNYTKGFYFIEVKTSNGWVTNKRILIQ